MFVKSRTDDRRTKKGLTFWRVRLREIAVEFYCLLRYLPDLTNHSSAQCCSRAKIFVIGQVASVTCLLFFEFCCSSHRNSCGARARKLDIAYASHCTTFVAQLKIIEKRSVAVIMINGMKTGKDDL